MPTKTLAAKAANGSTTLSDSSAPTASNRVQNTTTAMMSGMAGCITACVRRTSLDLESAPYRHDQQLGRDMSAQSVPAWCGACSASADAREHRSPRLCLQVVDLRHRRRPRDP